MVGYSLWYSSRVYPGVEVLGTQLGGMSRQEAVAAIEARAQRDLDRPVSFQLGQETARVSARELGLQFDAAGTADRALGVGRSGNWVEKWSGRIGVLNGGQVLPPVVEFREESATEVLRGLAPRVDQPVIDAKLTLGKDGPKLEPSQVGLALDVPATLGKLPSSLEALYAQQQPVQPVIRSTQPEVTEAHLQEALDKLSLAWSRPMVATFSGRTWTLPVEDVRPLLRLKGSGADITPIIRTDPLKEWVQDIASDIDRSPQSARIKVQTGAVSLVSARSGYVTNVGGTVYRLKNEAFGDDARVDAVVRIVSPKVTNAELRPAVEEADAMVRRPLRLKLGEETWTLTKSDLTDLLKWRGTGETRRAYIPTNDLREWVDGVAEDVYTAPVSARIEVDQRARVVREEPGLRVLVPETLRSVQSSLRDPAGVVNVRTSSVPAKVSADQLQKAAADANLLIGAPVTLTHEGEEWIADESELREWLRWEGEGADATPYLDQDEIPGFVEEIAEDVNVEARNAYVSSGAIPQLVEAMYGVRVHEEATESLLTSLARSPQVREGRVAVERSSPGVSAADLRPEYTQIRNWIDGRLYLRIGSDHTWWLDPNDISNAVFWSDAGGADINPYISTSVMETEIRRWVSNPPNMVINYKATAEEAVAALYRGDRSIEITYTRVQKAAYEHKGNEAAWGGNFPAKWIDINLTSQSMAAYEEGTQVRVTLITSGRPELATPTGTYYVMAKLSPYEFVSPWPKTSPYWYETATANYALRFTGRGHYIHDAPWRATFGPGTNGSGPPGASFTGSHGCVNVPYEAMSWLFSWVGTGVPIVIHY